MAQGQGLGTVVLYTLIPVVAALVGGLIAAFRPPRKPARSAIQHFAGGVVFAAAALELLPPVMAQPVVVALVGFGLGIAVMFALRLFERRIEGGEKGEDERGGEGIGLIVAAGVDVFIDGLVVGAGFVQGGRQGLLLTIALTLELLFLGLAIAVAVRGARWKIITTPTALALLLMAGAVIGFLALGGVSPAILAVALAFGAVVLMYLVTEELLVEAHKAAETTWAPSVFFVGFLVYLVITKLLG